ncbi:hypothetical protein HELRODRAFT_182478 [Helobdella robusta]|uniref:Uncharacterized protein n=1 Tax=Helobdella robusta TaxID=6412 RepID=T1FI91_HELRO|nr:hypothetical protein HELRODRAFT_182478 [Helobdella robusta]ESN90895.1 hypothetical protein HELRODRAFT_182478 [Helobdella robusta]
MQLLFFCAILSFAILSAPFCRRHFVWKFALFLLFAILSGSFCAVLCHFVGTILTDVILEDLTVNIVDQSCYEVSEEGLRLMKLTDLDELWTHIFYKKAGVDKLNYMKETARFEDWDTSDESLTTNEMRQIFEITTRLLLMVLIKHCGLTKSFIKWNADSHVLPDALKNVFRQVYKLRSVLWVHYKFIEDEPATANAQSFRKQRHVIKSLLFLLIIVNPTVVG